MHRLSRLHRKARQMRPRHRSERRLLPRGMGQPHQPQPRRIGLPLGIEGEKPLIREGLQQPVQRRLGIIRSFAQLVEAHGALEPRHEVEHRHRLADGPVACLLFASLRRHAASSVTSRRANARLDC